MDPRPDDLTRMIGDARGGDPAARERLYERIYSELRGIAQRTPRAGRAGDTLQPTVIVNELFVEFERRFPQAETLRIPDAGHYVFEDAHEIMLPRIEQFLQQ